MDDCLHAVGWCHCEPQVAPAQADVDAMFQTARVAPEPEQPDDPLEDAGGYSNADLLFGGNW